ncbi:hypothetical protein MKZ20_21870 [Psychrobacillus sp. FSL K6-2684]|uniref:hypothetical protein n=1 Tax=unclassified Psychrobacillus TaxID=2636677 RepID=UPI0030FBD611
MKNQSEWFQPKEEVYMLFLVDHALSSKPHLYNDITDVYQQRELTYYQAYRSYEVDLQQAFCHYPFEQVNAMIQSLGILQVAHVEQSYETIWPLIRKGYGIVWKHCKIHKEFNFEIIKGELAKRSNGFLDAEETANLFFVGIYLSHHKKDVSLFTDYSVVDEELKLFMGDILDKFKNKPEERVPLFSPIHEQFGRETSLDDLEQHIQFFKKSEHIGVASGKCEFTTLSLFS